MFMMTRAMGEYSDHDHSSASFGTLLMAPSSGFRKFNAKLHSADLRPRLSTRRIRTRRGADRRDRTLGVVCARGTTDGSVRSMSLVDDIAKNYGLFDFDSSRRTVVSRKKEIERRGLRGMRASRGQVMGREQSFVLAHRHRAIRNRQPRPVRARTSSLAIHCQHAFCEFFSATSKS